MQAARGSSVIKGEALYPSSLMPSITGSIPIQCYTLNCEILHYKVPHIVEFKN